MSLDAKRGGDIDLATAVGRYVLGEVSLGKAAELAGMTRWEFEEVLEAVGVDARLGPRDASDLENEVRTALDSE